MELKARSMIIFYWELQEVRNVDGVYLSPWLSDVVKEDILNLFNEKKISTLLVHIRCCTGWRTKLTDKEVVVLFTRAFTEQEMAQARARISVDMWVDNDYNKERF